MTRKPGAIDEKLVDLLIEKAEKNLLQPEAIPTLLHVVSVLYARYKSQAKPRLDKADLLQLQTLFNNMVETIMDKPDGIDYDEILRKIETKMQDRSLKLKEEDFQ